MSLSVEPFPKKLFDRAIELGVEEIVLRFQGGNDEGYLNIEINPDWNAELSEQIENWAWEAYQYNGAGDGSDYGDDITYDLVNKRATVQEWYTARTEGELIENDDAFEADDADESDESKA